MSVWYAIEEWAFSLCVCILKLLFYWYMLHDSRCSVAGSSAVCVLAGGCVCVCEEGAVCAHTVVLLVCVTHE